MVRKTRFKPIYLLIFLSIFPVSGNPLTLANLEYTNPLLKTLRSEVKENLRLSKSRSQVEDLIPLRYYQYKVKAEDQFFKIMARTGMDLETLSSVNELSSPHDLYVGMVLEIPNMRGTFHPEESTNDEKTRLALSKLYHLTPEKLQYDKSRSKWFLPGIQMGKLEKSFFYGFAFQYPLSEIRISSAFGKRMDPFTKKQTFHGGIDLAAKQGTDVFASQDGVVSFVGNRGAYGNLVILKHKMNYETRYGHLSCFSVKEGQKIRKGEKIGEVGQTGRATGPHLHFEVMRYSKKERPIFHSH